MHHNRDIHQNVEIRYHNSPFPIKKMACKFSANVLGKIECSSEVEIGIEVIAHDGHDIAVLVSKFIFFLTCIYRLDFDQCSVQASKKIAILSRL